VAIPVHWTAIRNTLTSDNATNSLQAGSMFIQLFRPWTGLMNFFFLGAVPGMQIIFGKIRSVRKPEFTTRMVSKLAVLSGG